MSNKDAHYRLQQCISFLKDKGLIHKQQDIADRMNLGKSQISEALKGKPGKLTEGFMKKFAAAFPQLSETYLLEGEGEPGRPDPSTTRPHFPVNVAAGYTDVALSTLTEADLESTPLIPWLPSYDFTIDVVGDSMLPLLESGDRVACRWLSADDAIKSTHLYLIDTARGAVVKYTRRDGSRLLCRSANPAYEPFTIEGDAVLRIALVVGLVRAI